MMRASVMPLSSSRHLQDDVAARVAYNVALEQHPPAVQSFLGITCILGCCRRSSFPRKLARAHQRFTAWQREKDRSRGTCSMTEWDRSRWLMEHTDRSTVAGDVAGCIQGRVD